MEGVEGSFKGVDGTEIFTIAWDKVAGEPKGVVFLLHGLHAHSKFEFLEMGTEYRDEYSGSVVQDLNEMGLLVYAHDVRGHGRSAGTRALLDFDLIYRDAEVFVDSTMAKLSAKKDLPVFLMGTSMGGLLSMNLWRRRPEKYTALILISPAMEAKVDDNNFILNALEKIVTLTGPIIPTLPVVQLEPANDATVHEQFLNDPLTWKGKVLLKTAYDFKMAFKTIPAAEITCPVLVLFGRNDQVVSVEAGTSYFEMIPSKDKEIKFMDNMWHDLLHEPGLENTRAIIKAWIAKRLDSNTD